MGIKCWVLSDRDSDVYGIFKVQVMYACVMVLVYVGSISNPCLKLVVLVDAFSRLVVYFFLYFHLSGGGR